MMNSALLDSSMHTSEHEESRMSSQHVVESKS